MGIQLDNPKDIKNQNTFEQTLRKEIETLKRQNAALKQLVRSSERLCKATELENKFLKGKIEQFIKRARTDILLKTPRSLENTIDAFDFTTETLIHTEDLYSNARRVYQEPKERQDVRARKALQVLGFVEKGKRPKSSFHNRLKYDLYLAYTLAAKDAEAYYKAYPQDDDCLKITFSFNAVKKPREAINDLAQEYKTSPNAVRQMINEYMIRERRRLKGQGIDASFLKTPPKVN